MASPPQTISPTILPTMRAIDPAHPGGPEVLRLVKRPRPRPGPGEVLIEVHAAGVNRADLLQRQGLYPLPAGAPTIPGLEVAGIVVACGRAVRRLAIGARVVALLSGGGYADYAVAPAGQTLPLPAPLSFAEGATLPEAWFTVWLNLARLGGARPGERLLVHGGTSGIGGAAIDFARLRGLVVFATCGTDRQCAAATAAGATAINYQKQDFVAEIRAATGGRGVDLILDMVGGDYVPRNLALLAPGGRHLSIAYPRGRTAEIDLARIMARQLRIGGSLLRPQPVAVKAAIARALNRAVWPALQDGRIRPHLAECIPLPDAAAAHRLLERGGHIGKIALAVR